MKEKANEIFVFHYNLLLLGSIWSNPVFKPLSFFLSDRRTSNSTRFDLRRCISGWEASAPEQYPDAHFLRHDPFSLLHSQVPHSLTRTSALLFAFGYTIPFTCARTLTDAAYNYDALKIGLVLLSFGAGSIFGSLLGGRWSDRELRRLTQANGGHHLPEVRSPFPAPVPETPPFMTI